MRRNRRPYRSNNRSKKTRFNFSVAMFLVLAIFGLILVLMFIRNSRRSDCKGVFCWPEISIDSLISDDEKLYRRPSREESNSKKEIDASDSLKTDQKDAEIKSPDYSDKDRNYLNKIIENR